MKLPNYVRVRPSYFRYIPILNKYTANSIYPYVFLPQDIYENLVKANPDSRYVALLIHEITHYKKQQRMGWFLFGVKYLFSARFRFNEELRAVKVAMKYLKKKGVPFNFDTKAKHLSSHLYLWPVSKSYAKGKLREVWDEI